MFTPNVVRHRNGLRQAVSDEYAGLDSDAIFDRLIPTAAAFIVPGNLERFCEKIECPAACLPSIFAPYGVKDLMITRKQWEAFMAEGLPTSVAVVPTDHLDEKQYFILCKYVLGLKTKFGDTQASRWAAALARNPPNSLNTTLHLTALCHLYENMNLPFSVAEFIDSLFAFYGERIETLTFDQFGQLFSFS
jgi:hypothetical protein